MDGFEELGEFDLDFEEYDLLESIHSQLGSSPEHSVSLCEMDSSRQFGVCVWCVVCVYVQYRPKVWTHLLIQRVFFIFMTMKIVDSH